MGNIKGMMLFLDFLGTFHFSMFFSQILSNALLRLSCILQLSCVIGFNFIELHDMDYYSLMLSDL